MTRYTMPRTDAGIPGGGFFPGDDALLPDLVVVVDPVPEDLRAVPPEKSFLAKYQ